MSVTHICESSYFSWPGTLHHVCWVLLVAYHDELIREQMPNDQKMKCEQWTPFLCWRSLSESPSEWPSRLGSNQQVGVSLPSPAEACSCMQAKGHCSIREQQQVIHVVSCCAGSLGACGGCLCAQMNLRGPGGRLNQSQLSSGASPLFEHSLLLFSPPHQMCQGSRQPISCFVLMKLSMEVYRWQSDTSGQRFSFISFMTLGGHGTGITKFYRQTITLSLLNVFGFWPRRVYVAFVSRLIL